MSVNQHHILFVDHTPFAGGGQLVLAEHIAALDKDQFRPYVACTTAVPILIERYEAAGALVRLVDMPRLRGISLGGLWQSIRAVQQLRHVIKSDQIELIVANTTRATYFVALAAVGLRVPVIWWVRDFLYPKKIFAWLKSQPQKIVFVSRAVRDYYLSDSAKAVVLYVASNLYKELVAITPQQIASERAVYGLTNQLVVGFMGRLVAEKGPEDVVSAVASLAKEYPQLRLLLVGTGKDQEHDVEARLHQLVDQQQLAGVVSFAGYQTNQALYYAMFDVFVLATRDAEPFATSVVQAMMAGATVIGTAAGGTPELVINGHTGLLYTPGEVPALVEALRQLLDHPDVAKKLAKAGQERVLQYHREEQLARQAEDIYRQVLDRS